MWTRDRTGVAEGKARDPINADLGLLEDKPTQETFEFLGGALKKR
jgi:hypothetical protein